MDKEQFNKLKIDEQIQYVNKSISKYGSSTAVSKAIGYKDESTLRKRFKSKGYHLNTEKTAYILINKNETKVKSKNQAVVANSSTNFKIKNKSETIVKNVEKELNNKNETLINKNLKELLAVKDDILEIVRVYKNKKFVACDALDEIKIDTERLKDESAMTRGIKTYPSVYSEFKKFCNEHKQYRMQDLVAMAFLEYIKNHS